MKITGINPQEFMEQTGKAAAPVKSGIPGFGDALKNSISKVNQLQIKADTAMQNLAVGKSENIHETMIAIEKAELAFKMMAQMRNKIMAAYQEIQRLSV